MVLGFVLVAEVLAGEEQYVTIIPSPQQKMWATIGMLRYALVFQEGRVQTFPDDDSE